MYDPVKEAVEAEKWDVERRALEQDRTVGRTLPSRVAWVSSRIRNSLRTMIILPID